jgi:hypothetical protein
MNLSRVLSITTLIAGVLSGVLMLQGALPKAVYGIIAVASALIAAFNQSVIKNFNVQPQPAPDIAPSVQATGQLQSQQSAATQQNQTADSAQPPAAKSKNKWLSILGLVASVAAPVVSGINPAAGAIVGIAANAAASSGGSLRQ